MGDLSTVQLATALAGIVGPLTPQKLFLCGGELVEVLIRPNYPCIDHVVLVIELTDGPSCGWGLFPAGEKARSSNCPP